MSSYLEELLYVLEHPIENVRFESVYSPKTSENVVTEPGVIWGKVKCD